MATDFSKVYCELILKKIVSKIVSDEKKKEKTAKVSMVTAETGSGVRSMKHWSSVANNEFLYKEIQVGFERMKDLDELTEWSDKLHQERFSFMKEKYEHVLQEYLTYYI